MGDWGDVTANEQDRQEAQRTRQPSLGPIEVPGLEAPVTGHQPYYNSSPGPALRVTGAAVTLVPTHGCGLLRSRSSASAALDVYLRRPRAAGRSSRARKPRRCAVPEPRSGRGGPRAHRSPHRATTPTARESRKTANRVAWEKSAASLRRVPYRREKPLCPTPGVADVFRQS